LRVDRDCGLVQKDQFRLVGDAAGDVQPAQQAPAQLFGQEAAEILKADKRDRLIDQLPALAPVRHIQAAEVVDVLPYRQFVENSDILHDDPDVALDVVGIRPHRAAKQLDGAHREFEQGQHAVDGRGLARAVGTEQAEYFAGLHGEVEMVQSDQVAVPLDQLFDFYNHGERLL